ncbi:SfnB family sulfur acquisition oxidoreductase [Microlunatus sp. GCM10028923]|uniref:SfnB family sulfur acquisition oxidoreductase n=1 Tax=Microlunatus sp. GCM10028923 TaxID=3273400 RepID=UPI00360E1D2B
MTARVVHDRDHALLAADELRRAFAVGAAERDRERRLPDVELAQLSASGLLAITVPEEYGGADVDTPTLIEVVRTLAAGDPNIAQIPQSHFVYLNILRRHGGDALQKLIFTEVLNGARLGNAQSEAKTKHLQDLRTRLDPQPDGSFLLTGEKQYSTGALFADWVPVLAKQPDDKLHVAFLPRDAEGLEVIDDWDGLGQRTTASGTVRLRDVLVPGDRVLPHHLTFTGPQTHGAVAQLLHAAIDAGIAAAALDEAAEFVRTKTRPWFESGVDHASEEPLLIQRFGELDLQLRSADALLAAAAHAVDVAKADPTDETTGRASLAVAAAKVATGRAALELSSAIFETGGTRSALASLNLDRHWRNARTHTLHDPERWKLQHLGRYALNGTLPPRHGVL